MKYKYILLGSLITIITLCVISIILVPFNKKEYVYIKSIDSYSKKITILKNELSELEDNSCKDSLNDMLNRINETNFKDKVTIEEYYKAYNKDEITFINLYENIINECKLENNDDIYIDVLTQMIFPNSIKEKYLLSHELILKDYSSRSTLTKSLSETGTYITKTKELNILKDLIEEVNHEEDL